MKTDGKKQEYGNQLGGHILSNLQDEVPYVVELLAPNTPVPITLPTKESSYRVTKIGANVKSFDGTPQSNAEAAMSIEFSEDFKVNSTIIFPALWDLSWLVCGLEVPPEERFWEDIDAPASSTIYTGKLVCTSTNAALYPIKVKFQLRSIPKEYVAKLPNNTE